MKDILYLLISGYMRFCVTIDIIQEIVHVMQQFYGESNLYSYPFFPGFDMIYKDFKNKYQIEEDESGKEVHLHRKRMIILVDRRQLSDDDEPTDHIYMYEPPSNCRDIPNDAVSDWYLHASSVCLLPNVNYGDGGKAILDARRWIYAKESKDVNVTVSSDSMFFLNYSILTLYADNPYGNLI